MSAFHGPTSQFFISQRLRLHYVDWGNPEAPPLILQHGGYDHCRSWDWLAQELRKDWHVICPDLRGHGDSAWVSDGHYLMLSYIYDFAQLVESLGYEQVTICGHSLGGMITSRYAGLFPERVRKLANIEGLGIAPKALTEKLQQPYLDRVRDWIGERRQAAGRLPRRYASLDEAHARMAESNPRLSEEVTRELTASAVARNEDGTYSWKFDPYLHIWPVLDMPQEQIEQLWAAVSCPVLFFHGADSWASNPEKDGRIRHFSDARVIEYANAGHWLHHDQFDRFLGDLRAFL